MSIRLAEVYVSAPSKGTKVQVLKGLSLEIPDGARTVILGLPKSGKTTLMRTICGTITADLGRVENTSHTSWPIPLTTFMAGPATVARNIRFVGTLYGVSDEDFPRKITDMMGIGEFLNVPLQKCPKIVKPRLAFGLGVGLDFDVYLFDGALSPSDKNFKPRWAEILAERLNGRGYVVTTANPKEVEENFDSVYVLEAGQVRSFAGVSDGVEYFKELLASQKEREAAAKESKQAEADDEDEGLSDIDVLAAAVVDEV
jgi:capsular polysaccharide transport system ATP-binding protein